MNRDAEYADIPLLMQDERRAARRRRRPLRLRGWSTFIIPDPFENKCLASETAPSPF